MAWPVRTQAQVWLVVLALVFGLLYVLGGVILPFLVGGALAYFLDPVADRLQRAGLSRVAATAVITITAVLCLVLLLLAVVPLLIQQTTGLIQSAPDIAQRLQGFLLNQFPDLADKTSTIRQSLAELGATIQSRGGELVQGLLTSALGLVSAVVFVVVVPVVTFTC